MFLNPIKGIERLLKTKARDEKTKESHKGN